MAIYIIASVCFFLLLVVHTYGFYPAYMFRYLAKNKIESAINTVYFPEITILCAAYNEADVIGKKLESIFETNYPKDKIHVLIGSDASTDATNEIIEAKAKIYPNIKLVNFAGRTGKAQIINQLVEICTTDIMIMTDANVFFQPDTFSHIVKHFKQENIYLVAGNIIKQNTNNEGIATQELAYINIENKLKWAESLKFNNIIGAEGGCYAIRKNAYSHVPKHIIVDDFFITMNVIDNGGHAIFEPMATCTEDASTLQSEEYRRKVRISIGNFQNLALFKNLLWPFWSGVGFAFISHKVLRWFTPFLLLLILVGLLLLTFINHFTPLFLVLWVVFLLSPIFDFIAQKLKQTIPILRFLGHFILMNIALAEGFYKYTKGVENSIWTPTKRNQ